MWIETFGEHDGWGFDGGDSEGLDTPEDVYFHLRVVEEAPICTPIRYSKQPDSFDVRDDHELRV